MKQLNERIWATGRVAAAAAVGDTHTQKRDFSNFPIQFHCNNASGFQYIYFCAIGVAIRFSSLHF